MIYDGPKIKKKYFKKKFCENFKPKNGFIKVKFIKICDGDTAYFDINGFNACVRFNVIDTPSCIDKVEPFGIEAKDFCNQLLTNAKEIYLESDVNNNLFDDTFSQRVLAWIWIDGKLLNYIIVRNGFATNKYIISNKMKYLKYLKQAYTKAKKEKLNIHN